MLQTAKMAALTALALGGLFSHGQALAAMPKPEVEHLQGRIQKQAPRQLNRVSMVEINAFNLFLPQLISQYKVGLASNRLSIVYLPSNFTPNQNQAGLLNQYDVREELVSANEGDIVNQNSIPSKAGLNLTRDASGTVHLSPSNTAVAGKKALPVATILMLRD